MSRILCVFLCLMVAACTAVQPATIRDLAEMPQDAGHYLPDPHQAFISPDRQAVLYRDWQARFFAPWHREKPRYGADEVFSGFRRYGFRTIYNETSLPLPPDWIEAMAREADRAAYPSRHLPAVTVLHASLRVFPTHKPVFFDPSAPGRGFPFDQMQNSLVAAGTPLLITHVSRSGEWALVETDWAAGWVRWPEIALVDPDFIRAYGAAPLIGFRADRIAVAEPDGRFLISGRVGMTLPLAGDPRPGTGWTVGVPVRDHLGRARIRQGVVSRADAGRLPFAATRDNAVELLNALMGQPYGWGGLYENRDCSALIQDLLGVFGIPLPRNSRDQARVGHWVALEGLGGPEKERLIRRQGVPLLTILYMPGHVMLYLGQDPDSGRAVACHAMWGIRTGGRNGSGRLVVGRTVVTSLEPGRELSGVPPGGRLLDRLTGMARLE
jgi:hypothetical protein